MAGTDLELSARIDAVLPQTQCTKCGYAGCRPYAMALVSGCAEINQCPPGGEVTIRALAILLNRPYKSPNPENGKGQPLRVALIDEALCIGCTLCIQACPVDAIVGGPKHLHTVIAQQCTGCDLCVPTCPVDCIKMIPTTDTDIPWNTGRADEARSRFEQHQVRRNFEREKRIRRLVTQTPSPDQRRVNKIAFIQAAIERARNQRCKLPAGNEHTAVPANRNTDC